MLAPQDLTGVGAELKRAREAAGLAISDVAGRLKLLPRQIESLEGERFDRLPGPAIARGMVRNYARLLNLDPEPLVARMAPPQENAPALPVDRRTRDQLQSSTASHRSTAIYVALSVVLLAAVGAFAFFQSQQKQAVPDVAAPAAPPPAQSAPVEQKPVEQQAALEEPPAVAAQAEPPPEPKPEAAPPPAPAPAMRRLVLRMEQEAWVEVRDSAGRNLLSSLNPAGSERAVQGQPPFEVVIGNAPHVKLTYDGKAVDLARHTRGEVARLTLR